MAQPDCGLEGARLLLVDDDPALCEALARAFERRGFDVTVASTERDALARARDTSPRCAVIDLRLPDRQGLELLSALLALDGTMRIVVLTAYGNIATAVEAIKRGAVHYLCKPASADEIVAAFEGRIAPTETPPHQPMSVRRLEWEHIWKVLRQHGGNVSQAARALSMHRRTLQRKLAKRPVRT
jgi:two-component system response regulator RegA